MHQKLALALCSSTAQQMVKHAMCAPNCVEANVTRAVSMAWYGMLCSAQADYVRAAQRAAQRRLQRNFSLHFQLHYQQRNHTIFWVRSSHELHRWAGH